VATVLSAVSTSLEDEYPFIAIYVSFAVSVGQTKDSHYV